jgi:hypothetical protein
MHFFSAPDVADHICRPKFRHGKDDGVAVEWIPHLILHIGFPRLFLAMMNAFEQVVGDCEPAPRKRSVQIR